MSITEKSAFGQLRRNWTSRLKSLAVDHRNRQRHGPEAPLFAERIWIPLDNVQRALKLWTPRDSGRVITEWPSSIIRPLGDLPTIQACLRHWRDGISWENTGLFAQMLAAIEKSGKVDKLRSLHDIEIRYRELDTLYLNVKKTGRLKSRAELIRGNFREEGGLLFHVGPKGEPFFGGKGNHRLAIALALELPFIPAQLGCTHEDGLSYLPELRVAP